VKNFTDYPEARKEGPKDEPVAVGLDANDMIEGKPATEEAPRCNRDTLNKRAQRIFQLVRHDPPRIEPRPGYAPGEVAGLLCWSTPADLGLAAMVKDLSKGGFFGAFWQQRDSGPGSDLVSWSYMEGSANVNFAQYQDPK
jgi:hypothetical protein